MGIISLLQYMTITWNILLCFFLSTEVDVSDFKCLKKHWKTNRCKIRAGSWKSYWGFSYRHLNSGLCSNARDGKCVSENSGHVEELGSAINKIFTRWSTATMGICYICYDGPLTAWERDNSTWVNLYCYSMITGWTLCRIKAKIMWPWRCFR